MRQLRDHHTHQTLPLLFLCLSLGAALHEARGRWRRQAIGSVFLLVGVGKPVEVVEVSFHVARGGRCHAEVAWWSAAVHCVV